MTRRVVALASDLKLERASKKEAPLEGLASLAGGWEGSEELVERISELRRTFQRLETDFD
jgi:hypothetical protein